MGIRLSRFLPALVVVVFGLAVGCGVVGDDSKRVRPTWETATPRAATAQDDDGSTIVADDANVVAHSALPDVSELGERWSVAETDAFDSDALAAIPGCEPLLRAAQDVEADVRPRLGRARQRYVYSSATADWLAQPELVVTVDVFKDSAAAQTYLASYRDAWKNGAFTACEGARLEAIVPAGTDVLAGVRASRVHVGDEWASTAVEMNTTVDGTRYEARTDAYATALGNAVMYITMSGPASSVDAELLEPLVHSQYEGLRTLLNDPTARPHDPFVLQPEETPSGLPGEYVPAERQVSMAEYVKGFCAAASEWREEAASIPLPDTSGSGRKAEQIAYFDALRAAQETYVKAVAAAGYPYPDMGEGFGFARRMILVLLRARGLYEQASARTALFPDDETGFTNMSDQLALDLAKGSVDVVKDLVGITAEFDTSAFDAAVAAEPGCAPPWADGGPSGVV